MPDFTYPKIILFGDSLVEKSFNPLHHGFGASLANDYARKADVLNRGVSGYTSRWLLPHFHTLINEISTQKLEVILFVIWLGTNDACLPQSPHHVPLPEYSQNMHTILTTLLTHLTKTKILVLTPPPFYSSPTSDPRRDPHVTSQYASVPANLLPLHFPNEPRIRHLDIHSLISTHVDKGPTEVADDVSLPGLNLQNVFTDGLHLDWKGYDIVHEAILKLIAEEWEDIAPQNLSLTVPWWGDLISGSES